MLQGRANVSRFAFVLLLVLLVPLHYTFSIGEIFNEVSVIFLYFDLIERRIF